MLISVILWDVRLLRLTIVLFIASQIKPFSVIFPSIVRSVALKKSAAWCCSYYCCTKLSTAFVGCCGHCLTLGPLSSMMIPTASVRCYKGISHSPSRTTLVSKLSYNPWVPETNCDSRGGSNGNVFFGQKWLQVVHHRRNIAINQRDRKATC